MTGATITTSLWEQLVTTALLGTDRRALPPGVAGPGGGDAAVALLDAAAVHTVRRRAGLLPATAAEPPEPAPADHRPPLPEGARRRLEQLLADRAAGSSGGRRGAAPDLTELLPQWLATAQEQGYRAPVALVPALLDAARARTDLRPQTLAFAGSRGLWLARFNPEWRFALRGAPGSTVPLPEPAAAEQVREVWEEGLFAERVALLTAVRAEDPGRALALLSGSWATERAEDRLMFLDTLRTELSPADEPFLERALADRSRNVRAAAAELLSSLPGSALAGRMAERAASCVGPDHGGAGAAIHVEAPHECDTDMQHDGVVPSPPPGRGKRSWWLGQLVAAAPLAVWTRRFGDRSPEEVVALPVTDGWREELHGAWCRAAVRQADATWSRALLGPPGIPPENGPGTVSLAERAKLLATLPQGERADWVAAFISAHGLSEAFQLLGVCAVPWSPALGDAVVDALETAREAGSYPWSFSGAMGLAERCLHPSAVARLDPLTVDPDGPEGSSPGAEGYWSEAFQRLTSTLRLREAMHRELTGSAP
ncbi:DUF5691 domain-containing protein [Streptomyces yaizuensis]|uniref:DUF5691 domain-containing protein n=1 Tax=Streptomyces yaizuensis TaxID=2989713 RepID=A0ABQ5P550_9ACTN|nr:DUF5691 domain-containing protein [Streptomyces sp. YSPA8]GLF97657.1 DUF5691 domain-containing protein [Streptomyces sp. YSPA8]